MQYQADISYEEDKASFYENNQNMTVPEFHTREISSTTYVKNLFKKPNEPFIELLEEYLSSDRLVPALPDKLELDAF
ncbi:unnamed protein product [Pichia kudriavzevii]